MRFKRKVKWKCVQVTMVTWDKIELKSVFLTIVTWDLKERWTENVSKYEIELKSLYLTW